MSVKRYYISLIDEMQYSEATDTIYFLTLTDEQAIQLNKLIDDFNKIKKAYFYPVLTLNLVEEDKSYEEGVDFIKMVTDELETWVAEQKNKKNHKY